MRLHAAPAWLSRQLGAATRRQCRNAAWTPLLSMRAVLWQQLSMLGRAHCAAQTLKPWAAWPHLVQVVHRAVEGVHKLVPQLRVLRQVPPPPALVQAAAVAWGRNMTTSSAVNATSVSRVANHGQGSAERWICSSSAVAWTPAICSPHLARRRQWRCRRYRPAGSRSTRGGCRKQHMSAQAPAAVQSASKL